MSLPRGLEVSVHALGQSPSQAVALREEQPLVLRALQRLPIEMQTAIELSGATGARPRPAVTVRIVHDDSRQGRRIAAAHLPTEG